MNTAWQRSPVARSRNCGRTNAPRPNCLVRPPVDPSQLVILIAYASALLRRNEGVCWLAHNVTLQGTNSSVIRTWFWQDTDRPGHGSTSVGLCRKIANGLLSASDDHVRLSAYSRPLCAQPLPGYPVAFNGPVRLRNCLQAGIRCLGCYVEEPENRTSLATNSSWKMCRPITSPSLTVASGNGLELVQDLQTYVLQVTTSLIRQILTGLRYLQSHGRSCR